MQRQPPASGPGGSRVEEAGLGGHHHHLLRSVVGASTLKRNTVVVHQQFKHRSKRSSTFSAPNHPRTLFFQLRPHRTKGFSSSKELRMKTQFSAPIAMHQLIATVQALPARSEQFKPGRKAWFSRNICEHHFPHETQWSLIRRVLFPHSVKQHFYHSWLFQCESVHLPTNSHPTSKRTESTRVFRATPHNKSPIFTTTKTKHNCF